MRIFSWLRPAPSRSLRFKPLPVSGWRHVNIPVAVATAATNALRITFPLRPQEDSTIGKLCSHAHRVVATEHVSGPLLPTAVGGARRRATGPENQANCKVEGSTPSPTATSEREPARGRDRLLSGSQLRLFGSSPTRSAKCRVSSMAEQPPRKVKTWVRFLHLAPATLALTGCAHVPLVTSCISEKQYQQLESQRPPKVHDKLTGQADKDVRPLAGSIIEHRAYEDVLLGTLKVCAK